MSTGVSSPAPVTASPEEPLPVLPVDEGLLTTAATDVVVVVTPALVAGTVVVVVVEAVVVVDDVVVVDEPVVVAGSGVTEQHGAVPAAGRVALSGVPSSTYVHVACTLSEVGAGLPRHEAGKLSAYVFAVVLKAVMTPLLVVHDAVLEEVGVTVPVNALEETLSLAL